MTEVPAPLAHRSTACRDDWLARLQSPSMAKSAALSGTVSGLYGTCAHVHECERVSRGNGCIPGRSKLFSHQTAYPGGTQRLLSGTKLKSPPGEKTPQNNPKQTIQSNVKPQLLKGTRIKKSEVSQKNIPAARNCIYALCSVKWGGIKGRGEIFAHQKKGDAVRWLEWGWFP